MTLKTTTMKAPVGPPICTRLPPNREMKKPATTAVTRPLDGSAPDAIAMARLNGNATMATVTPAARSAANRAQLYSRMVVRIFGWRMCSDITQERRTHGNCLENMIGPAPRP